MQAIQQNKIKVKITLYIIYSVIVISFLTLLSSIYFNLVLSSSAHAESLSYHVSVEESLNVTVKPSNVSIDLNPETKQFGIANLDVSVGTNYINGYKLYINSTSTNLTNTDYTNGTHGVGGAVFYIPTLDSGTTATASNFPTNHWGYRVSMASSNGTSITDPTDITTVPNIVSLDSTLSSPTDATYYPFSSGTLISSAYTATADNTTTLTFGAKADYDKPAGSYTNTFSFNATANPVTYSITYTDNTGDSSVTNLPTPNPASGMIAGTIIPVSSIVPERTGYTFKSWCMGTVSGDGTVCTGTEFTAGSNIDLEADKITDTTFTLTALWTANKYTCTNRYYLQNVSGGWDGPTTASTSSVDFNTSCSYGTSANPISRTDYKASTSSTTAPSSNNATAYTSCTITTSGCTNTLYFYRNTYALTVSKGSNISSVSGQGTYRWGQSVSISATPTSTYRFSKWTISGTTGTLTSTTAASTTYTMPKGASTVTAAAAAVSFNTAYSEAGKSTDSTSGKYKMQDMTTAICTKVTNGQTSTLTDMRGTTHINYSVGKINGNCWMRQNLRLGPNIDLTSSNSNVSSPWTTPASSKVGDSSSSDYITARLWSGSNRYFNENAEGNYYNYCAASAGTKCGDSITSDDTYNICPKGWTLPSGTQIDTITGNATYREQFSPYKGCYHFLAHGFCYVGSGAVGSQSTWWSRTVGVTGSTSSTTADKRFNTMRWPTSGSQGTNANLDKNNQLRTIGMYVRCIAK